MKILKIEIQDKFIGSLLVASTTTATMENGTNYIYEIGNKGVVNCVTVATAKSEKHSKFGDVKRQVELWNKIQKEIVRNDEIEIVSTILKEDSENNKDASDLILGKIDLEKFLKEDSKRVRQAKHSVSKFLGITGRTKVNSQYENTCKWIMECLEAKSFKPYAN